MRILMLPLIARLCWMSVLVVPLVAQTSSTEISGLVSDPSGAPVAGAEVTLTRLATGETRHVSEQ